MKRQIDTSVPIVLKRRQKVIPTLTPDLWEYVRPFLMIELFRDRIEVSDRKWRNHLDSRGDRPRLEGNAQDFDAFSIRMEINYMSLVLQGLQVDKMIYWYNWRVAKNSNPLPFVRDKHAGFNSPLSIDALEELIHERNREWYESQKK